MQLKPIALALIAFGAAGFAQANDNSRIAQLEAQLKAMQAQIEELKKVQKEEITQLQDQVTAQGKEAVVIGDLPNSYRLANSDVSIRLYGVAEANLVHETRGSNADSDYSTFMPYAPLNGSNEANRRGQTYMHARTSRLGVEAAMPTSYGQLTAKIEGDFNNDPRTGNSAVYGTLNNIYTQQATNSYNFRLRHAYVQVGSWLVGQTWSSFMDVDATPEVVDFNGPIGSTFIRQPQVRYTYVTPNYGNFTAAIENSVSYVLEKKAGEDPAATKNGFSRTPDLILRWDKPFTWGTLSLRGVTHEHRIDNGDSIDASRRGYGLAASGTFKPTGDDTLSFIATGGEGIGRYFNYIEGAAYNANNNSIAMERAAGLVLGYQHKFSDTLRMNLAYGMQRNFNNAYTDLALAQGFGGGRFGVNRRVSQLHVGGIWNPIKFVDIGAEWIYGQRETLIGEKGEMSRLNLMARYNFN